MSAHRDVTTYKTATTGDTKEEMDALWKARVGYRPASHYDSVRPMVDSIKADWPLQGTTAPPPSYVVKLNGTYQNRPAYAIVSGVRTTTIAGRVATLPVQAACDCAAFKDGEYCSVAGQPNVATIDPSDKLGASAALCTLAK